MSKTAVITGAARGLGFELSRLLARDGFTIIMVDNHSENLKRAEEAIIRDYGVNVIARDADLSKPGSPKQIYRDLEDFEIDILINNAGFGLSGAFSKTDWDLEEAMINLHILAATQLTKLVMKDMLKRGSGRIMNISSVAALGPGPLMSVYYATKAYLLSFGTAVAHEIKGTGVSLTTFCPGVIKTDFQGSVAKRSGVPEMRDGRFTDSAGKIALLAYRAMMKGKVLSIPLFKNKAMAFMIWLFPRNISARLIMKIQQRIHK